MKYNEDPNSNNKSDILNVLSPDFCLKKFETVKFNIGEKTSLILKQPTAMFLKDLAELGIKSSIIQRAEVYFSRTEQDRDMEMLHFSETTRAEILDKIKQSLKNKKEFPHLSARECRALLSYDRLYSSNLKHMLFDYMASHYTPTSILIKSLLLSYFNLYDILKNDLLFKKYLTKTLQQYLKQTRKIKPAIRVLVSDCNLLKDDFCSDLAIKCLKIKLETLENLNQIIANRYPLIPPNSEIYKNLITNIGLECFKNIHNDLYFNVLVTEILQSKLEKSEMDIIVSMLLELFAAQSKLGVEKQRILRDILLKHPSYGDPRIRPLNWEGGISSEAKRTFMTWLAKEDLEFFFNVVFEDKLDEHGRKKFWFNYIKSRELQYSKVILSEEDASHYRIREAQKEGRQFATFSSSMDGTSCFILVFDRATIVEFSKSGNALYLYDNNKLKLRSNQMQYRHVGELKKPNAKEYKKTDTALPDLSQFGTLRVRHTEGWQSRTSSYLSKCLGIYKGENIDV